MFVTTFIHPRRRRKSSKNCETVVAVLAPPAVKDERLAARLRLQKNPTLSAV